jgi:hypothetical protein
LHGAPAWGEHAQPPCGSRPTGPLAGHTIDGVAHDLGVARKVPPALDKQAEIEAGRAEGLTTEEREKERTILVKAAAFFAKENHRTR